MNEKQKPSNQEHGEIADYLVADAMLEVINSQNDAESAGQKLTDAFVQYQRGEITGAQYAEISHPQSYSENIARDAADGAMERINNGGRPRKASRTRRFLGNLGLRRK